MNKKSFVGIVVLFTILISGLFLYSTNIYAEESTEQDAPAENATTSVGLTPVSQSFKIKSGTIYDSSFTVNNDSDRELNFEIFSAPYSYVYSEENQSYQLGFSNENNFTQISRWISFDEGNGSYAKTLAISIEPRSSKEVNYRVTTPDNIPAGGQYAVIFARTTNGVASTNGVKTEASPGMIVYGRSEEGELDTTSEISALNIHQTINDGESTKNSIGGTAKVKNAGNVDFMATGALKIEGFFGGVLYETPENMGRITVVPDSELVVSDDWVETPGFGIYKVTWTVTASGKTEKIEQVIAINILPVIIIAIIILTILIVGCIIGAKKRRARRSRLAI